MPKGRRSDIGSPRVTRCAKELRSRCAARQLIPGCLGQEGKPSKPTQFACELDRAIRKEGRVHQGQINGHRPRRFRRSEVQVARKKAKHEEPPLLHEQDTLGWAMSGRIRIRHRKPRLEVDGADFLFCDLFVSLKL